jgi:hypothetical protein
VKETIVADGFNSSELPSLKRLFWVAIGYLVVVVGSSLAVAICLATRQTADLVLLAVAAGIAGSGTAALVSCLDRRAHGFEDSEGHQVPVSSDRVERFNEGMFPWFLIRPWLGAVVAAVVYWGFVAGTGSPGTSTTDPAPARVAFLGLLSGLFAKIVLDLLRNIPKNVFRT